jgi:hypothetical protein
MRGRSIGAALVAGFVIAAAGPVLAQQRQAAPTQPATMDEDEADQPAAPPQGAPARRSRTQPAAPATQPDPNLDSEDQLAPSQMKQPMPSAVAQPSTPSGRKTTRPPATHAAAEQTPEATSVKPSRPAAVRTIVACSGPFAKDSSMLGLATAFDSRNVTFTEIDAAGSKVGASVLFPKDPKRRLEVWWSNPGNRSGTYLIVINGQSTWSGPGGMRLGLTLQELEKLNHKPFKLKGFDKDSVATVSDWDGGALATLSGGCKSGLSLHADPKAPADAVTAAPADHEFSSADPAIRAAKPKVSEILIGY